MPYLNAIPGRLWHPWIPSMVGMHSRFGGEIALDFGQPLWMPLDIRGTSLGKLVSAVFRLPQVQIEVNRENGISFRKRLVPKTVES